MASQPPMAYVALSVSGLGRDVVRNSAPRGCDLFGCAAILFDKFEGENPLVTGAAWASVGTHAMGFLALHVWRRYALTHGTIEFVVSDPGFLTTVTDYAASWMKKKDAGVKQHLDREAFITLHRQLVEGRLTARASNTVQDKEKLSFAQQEAVSAKRHAKSMNAYTLTWDEIEPKSKAVQGLIWFEPPMPKPGDVGL